MKKSSLRKKGKSKDQKPRRIEQFDDVPESENSISDFTSQSRRPTPSDRRGRRHGKAVSVSDIDLSYDDGSMLDEDRS